MTRTRCSTSRGASRPVAALLTSRTRSRIQSLETSLATCQSIEIAESQAFQAAKRKLEAERRGW